MRCLMCEEPDMMYVPSDDVDDVGLYSCGACGFEIESPLERPSRPLPPTIHTPLHRREVRARGRAA